MNQMPPLPDEEKPKEQGGKHLKHLSVVSLISNVLGLMLIGPLMGWVCGRLGDAYSRLDQPLPAMTAWFMHVSWTKLTIWCVVLSVMLVVMERKVRRAGITLAVHLLVTTAVGVLIGAFVYAMILPMLGMIGRTGLS